MAPAMRMKLKAMYRWSSAIGADRNQIRLVQRGPDSYEYVTLQDLNGVPAGTEFPVSFPSIKGIYGVETGKVQVINSDTGELLGSYDVTFAPR